MSCATADTQPRLSDLDVLVVDCQATAAAPRGHLVEIGWTSTRTAQADVQTRLIALPHGERMPPAVARITGLHDDEVRGGVEAPVAWLELVADAAAFRQQPAPTVIHFAKFEQPFLESLAGATLPLDIVCTHAIAARLLPDLPRRSLRALAGYFGSSVGALRRSADHVRATAFIWAALSQALERDGVSTWHALRSWLASPTPAKRRSRRVWPMPRDVRLSLPDAPGVYRMLRTNGDVLYVGKAASLRDRVNSHFRHQRGIDERALEMLSQARGIAFDVAPTPLEAALREADEIKRHRPPYNVALAADDRALWYAPPDFMSRSRRPSPHFRLGPFPSPEVLDDFAALARRKRDALGSGRWSADPQTFDAGYARFSAAHAELLRSDVSAASRLLQLGTRLWAEGRRDRDLDPDEPSERDRRLTPWTPELVQASLEWLALRAAQARRRANWFTRLFDAALIWSEPGSIAMRLIVIENGDVVSADAVAGETIVPVPPGHDRPFPARRENFTLARFDRLRVLTTELKRVAAAGAPVAVRFSVGVPLTGPHLAVALSWL